MILKHAIALAVGALSLFPAASFGGPHKAKAAPTVYACQKCHMRFTAAQAKKDHYKDPMDGGKLVPVKTAAGKNGAAMKGMKM